MLQLCTVLLRGTPPTSAHAFEAAALALTSAPSTSASISRKKSR
eukprot:CAMPEP_0181199092 /NCGR_PEP_ID=MMETSP1096-20121128/16988_1 /TAXON_ID=156174 ORGANISM="Chrysochromulina ericina, Strain CCMP281" /NCGR_SAMPLE_ID=MMETSP1096 /ASSEMBLY_ACC=CAM_ASM_000453 /LENGTH=43 /DNA_ID= /DNA_START= /DNA_END= /DNA_ORIENTATION=